MAHGIEHLRLFGDESLTIDETSEGITIEGDFHRSKLEVYGHAIDPHDNHARFLATEYGTIMRGISRYSTFLEQTEAAKDRDPSAAAQWHEWLGPDVQLALHEPHTSRIARYVLDSETVTDFSPTEVYLLLFTAHHHDKGEAIVGDISYTAKTEADEAEEAIAMKTLLAEVFPEYPSQIVTDLLSVTWKCEDPSLEKIHQTFNHVERIGYLDTALRAWKAAHVAEASRHDRKVLKALAREVSGRHFPVLTEAASAFSSVADYLKRVRFDVQQIQERTATDNL